ncbi:MAG: DUF2974 domain-containing protein [Clostridia bacterium]|nr:DUF2974 domain-containing protein [Clostridia bacterium]
MEKQTSNIIDYLLWRGDLSFSSSSFNEVDGAIVSRITYLPFELVKKPSGKTLGSCMEEMLSDGSLKERLLLEDDLEFIQTLKESPRFSELKVGRFESRFDAAEETQFGAITLDIDPNTRAAAFRGTDDTLIGWKEDLNMGFLSPVPSQTLAAGFLNGERSRRVKKLIVCGHSKGGNVAIYAASFCEESVRKRIEAVFNYDGPGFPREITDSPEYSQVVPLTRTFVPQSSVVGLLMDRREECEIVHSTQKNILWQHDLYSWEVAGTKFVKRKAIEKTSLVIKDALREWSEKLDREQFERFTDAIYRILSVNDVSTLKQLGENRIDSAASALRSVKNLDKPTKAALKTALQTLIKCAGDGFFKAVVPAGNKQINSRTEKKQ